MSSKRVWAVRGLYSWRGEYSTRMRPMPSMVAEHDTIEAALEDVEYLWDAGFGSSMRSYVVPA
jgi:hypothetical protein